MATESEAELDALMGRLATGDRSAFEPLFRALRPRAQRFARARMADDRAEDVAQSALLRVFAHAHRFVAGRPALPWFYAIVANEIRAARRDARREDSEAAPDLRAAEAQTAEELLLTRELLRALDLAVATLDDDAAAAIHAQLGTTERPLLTSSTFRKRVSRAYTRLRVLLGELR